MVKQSEYVTHDNDAVKRALADYFTIAHVNAWAVENAGVSLYMAAVAFGTHLVGGCVIASFNYLLFFHFISFNNITIYVYTVLKAAYLRRLAAKNQHKTKVYYSKTTQNIVGEP